MCNMRHGTSVQIHPWPTYFGRSQYEHLDKWDEGGGAAPSKRRGVSGLPPHPFVVYNHLAVIMVLVQPLQVAHGAMKLYEQVCQTAERVWHISAAIESTSPKSSEKRAAVKDPRLWLKIERGRYQEPEGHLTSSAG